MTRHIPHDKHQAKLSTSITSLMILGKSSLFGPQLPQLLSEVSCLIPE